MRENYVFYYNGNKFEAIGNILGGFYKKAKAINYQDMALSEVDYNEFYKTARKNHASVDAYKINDSEDYYILCGSPKGKFFQISDLDNLKLVDDYMRWYKWVLFF